MGCCVGFVVGEGGGSLVPCGLCIVSFIPSIDTILPHSYLVSPPTDLAVDVVSSPVVQLVPTPRVYLDRLHSPFLVLSHSQPRHLRPAGSCCNAHAPTIPNLLVSTPSVLIQLSFCVLYIHATTVAIDLATAADFLGI